MSYAPQVGENHRADKALTAAIRRTLCGSTVALAIAIPAYAQDTTAEPTIEAVVVTGSRIKRDGYSAPTPTTIVTAEDIAESAPGTVADGLNQLPQFQGSSQPQSGGVSANGAVGANLLSLRNLGSQRTLILLDGRRFVASTDGGSTDINTLPQNLIERVDVVTGGASAAYGSDAVAGVVNFVLDTDYEGWKSNVQGGTSTYGDADSMKFSIAHGRGFAEGRGHLLLSGEYYDSKGIGPYDDNRDWNVRESGRIDLTGVSPSQLLLEDDLVVSAATFGGLITAGPLTGTQFGPGGVPMPFAFGSPRSASFMVGGDGIRNDRNLSAGLERWSVFGRASYDVTDSVNAFVEATYADSHGKWEQYYNYCYTSCAATIFRDNAYLPEATRQAMINTNIQSFRLNRIHSENFILADNDKTLWRGAVGLNGSLAGDWTYDAYFTMGESETRIANLQTLHYRRYYAAIDAVVNPATGQIVCRSTLSGLDPGCAPFNPFGAGSPSAEAMAYVTPDEWRNLVLEQKVAAASIQGTLFKIGDRDAGFAAGIEWREESSDQTVSPIAQELNDFTGLRGGNASIQGQEGPFIVGNPQPLAGSFNVKEVFAELSLPLLHDLPLVKVLEADVAGRYTEYSLSGGVNTWKGSLNYAPVEGVRLRTTRSRDIRGPNVAELFTGARQGIGTARDPATGQTVDVVTKTRGNPDLDPEIADTLTAGVVWQPSFLEGFSVSADYYNIEIEGAIATLGRQEAFDLCYAGNQTVCDNIELVGTTYRVDLPFLNLSLLEIAGYDFEASYVRPVGPGDLALRLFANYQYRFRRTTPGGVAEDLSGEVGLSSNPEWKGKLSATYTLGAASIFVQERYIDSGAYDLDQIEGVTINRNHVDAVWYTDLTATFKFGAEQAYEAYLTVNNVFDEDPAFAPQVSGTHLSWSNFELYDTIGRYFTLGARMKF